MIAMETGPRCQLKFCFRCGASYSSMKANGRSAHADHCFWHGFEFDLRDRAPAGEKVADWERMPETTTSNPSFLRRGPYYRLFEDIRLRRRYIRYSDKKHKDEGRQLAPEVDDD